MRSHRPFVFISLMYSLFPPAILFAFAKRTISPYVHPLFYVDPDHVVGIVLSSEQQNTCDSDAFDNDVPFVQNKGAMAISPCETQEKKEHAATDSSMFFNYTWSTKCSVLYCVAQKVLHAYAIFPPLFYSEYGILFVHVRPRLYAGLFAA